MPMTEHRGYEVLVCFGMGCERAGSRHVKARFETQLSKIGLDHRVRIRSCSCRNSCGFGPVVEIAPSMVVYGRVHEKDVPDIVREHLVKGKPVDRLRIDSRGETALPRLSDLGFFKHQVLVVLRNRGMIDPDSIEDSIAQGGYEALAKVLTRMDPEEVLSEIEASGLRGRGGAGFPTARKWRLCRAIRRMPKCVVCNADEGDPGAYMDRSLLESDPHAVLEGMAIGGRVIGADQGFIYVRDEYPLAVEKVGRAIHQAVSRGLLGKNVLNMGFDFDVTVVRGGGAFVCGEETALLASIEGRPGRPCPRPPYPTEQGLWGRPTVINNVETWAAVAPILRNGGSWYASLGSGTSRGTKIFSLVGKVRNTGLIEVPMGISLRTVVEEIGGGVPGGRKVKAVQTGGPSGGCIPESLLDLPIEYEALKKAGSIMGSGGLIVMDEDTCMVDVARYFIAFLAEESCGKCVPCRIGLARMKEILDRIVGGEAREEDIGRLEDLARTVQEGSLCGLGRSAPNPVLSTLRYFRDEYDAHVQDRRCPARICRALLSYSIDESKCTGCGACRKVCPVEAVSGEIKTIHRIEGRKCTRCGLCREACRFDAVVVA